MSENFQKRSDLLSFAKPDFTIKEKDTLIRVLDTGWLTSGPEVKNFENEFAKEVNIKYAIAVNSCTAALHLIAAYYNFNNEDAVIIPAITFTATAEIFEYSGCLPFILDVDRETYLLTPKKVLDFIKSKCIKIENDLIHVKTKRKIKAIIPVHLGGRPCDMIGFRKICDEYNLKLIDDAAHAFPSKINNNYIGSKYFADATAFSFYATKNLSTGEGGMITTQDDKMAEKIKMMRLHGILGQTWGRKRWKYDVVCEGYKYNMMDLTAALGRVQLSRAHETWLKRRSINDVYERELYELVKKNYIKLNPKTNFESSYHLFIIEINPENNLKLTRDDLVEKLYERNIAVSLHFIPLYRLSYYKNKYNLKEEDFPNSEVIYSNMLSIPIYSAMTVNDINDVILSIKDIFS